MICWITPFTGIAGDMTLGALIDAGAPLEGIEAAIGSTGLTGWELTAERVVTHGLAATRAEVRVTDTATERAAAEVIALAARARPEPVAALATAALTAIADVEGRLHGEDPAHVHLHELGGHDALVDIVGVAAALHLLGVTEVYCGPLPLGSGTVTTRHGVLPVPAPATAALLTGARVTGSDLRGETVTPTGAALLRAMSARYDPPPDMTVVATGYGAGTRLLPDRPNIVAVTLAHRSAAVSHRASHTDGPAPGHGTPPAPTEPATRLGRTDGGDAPSARLDGVERLSVLETNVDDVTGEVLGHTIGRALAAGALDAWVTPATMKKGRPAHVLHVLCRPPAVPVLRELVFAETGALGVRELAVERTALPRHVTEVELDGHRIRIKHGPHAAKPEYDDVAAAATALDSTLRETAARALLMSTEQEEHGRSHRDGDGDG
ncbi:nickel pincer cofactor biosynthesis protein LarC [Streptosporangium soli]|nr:nickel pincer cofactor biosynthesis protein LarC [Streptosporangium sp. KLBMP 9127]